MKLYLLKSFLFVHSLAIKDEIYCFGIDVALGTKYIDEFLQLCITPHPKESSFTILHKNLVIYNPIHEVIKAKIETHLLL